ncbi:hypothetical protein JTB14_002438 [Gonioctena quinquepunctata]|nr:hypothetical protein JTB14_002438 [Gonioctena quinquepunctata]
MLQLRRPPPNLLTQMPRQKKNPRNPRRNGPHKSTKSSTPKKSIIRIKNDDRTSSSDVPESNAKRQRTSSENERACNTDFIWLEVRKYPFRHRLYATFQSDPLSIDLNEQ